jgi:radical SAM superfamily enzyme YgiQ (UPF0313 family)
MIPIALVIRFSCGLRFRQFFLRIKPKPAEEIQETHVMNKTDVHPLGKKATILLSSVFGPYARDDEYGSRTINPMELYQNQVTRVQGAFSLRMFHRSFGLMLIQKNIEAPCTLLDFPTLQRFVQELTEKKYDIIGISAIIPNLKKVRKMCALIREHQPHATIVVGGHIANKERLHEIIAADHIVKGEGVKWFREFLGQDPDAPIKHPEVSSCHGTRILGHTLREKPGDTAAILIPSVGCPLGCNFCSTSALFGGKGKSVNFYKTGDELFDVMCRLEKKLSVQSFFVMDENFLFHRKRALQLMKRMQAAGKSWMLNVFSSARVLKSYTMEQLAGLGIGWVWMGIEGSDSRYRKLAGIDSHKLVKKLQNHGIRVLGSSIIGLEDHCPENMDQVIQHAVSHDTVFHQFMLYTPIPGTPLHAAHKEKGTLLDDSQFPEEDAHGQYRFNYRHPHIHNGIEEKYLLDAFQRDFTVNGPSLFRLIAIQLKGWQRYKAHGEKRIRDRWHWESKPLRTTYAGAVWAMAHRYRNHATMGKKINSLLQDLYREFGAITRITAPVIGRYLLFTLKKEEQRLARGWAYEPSSFYEKNPAAEAIEKPQPAQGLNNTPAVDWAPGMPSPVRGR